jgi:hypothetical protein
VPKPSPFVVELFRRSPAGPLLYLVALVALAFLWYSFEVDPTVAHDARVAAVVVLVVSLLVGMPLTHRAAFRLTCERRAQEVDRSAAPWEQ